MSTKNLLFMSRWHIEIVEMDYREKIREIMCAKGLTQQKVAKAIGVTQAHLSRMLSGERDIGVDDLIAIARVLDVHPAWLLIQDIGELDQIDDRHIFIPLYKVSAAAGLCGIITGEYPEIEERFPFKRYWLKKKGYEGEKVSGLALIRARGESMEPTISDGEIMLVDLNEQVRVPEAIRNGAIYVVRWGITKEEISVKRVHLDWAERKAILISDNELYRPKEIDLTEYERLQDFILARVIWVGKENI